MGPTILAAMGHRTQNAWILVVVAITLCCGDPLGAAPDGRSAVAEDDDLEGALAQLAELDADERRARAEGYGLSVQAERVRVVIEPANGRRPASLAAPIKALGGRQVAMGERLASANVPMDRLQALARRAGVAFVRRPLTARPLEAASLAQYASATLPTGARLMHNYGVRGQDVRIAVIDQGFAQLQRYMSDGRIDRDAVVERVDVGGEGMAEGGEHGTRVARVVHTMAPQAELVLINLGESSDEVVLERAVDRALDHDVDIINHSIGWFGSNFGDGTGPVDALVREVHERGVLWVNAAGNQARQHWIGQAADRDGDGWLEFKPGRDHLYVGSVPSGGDGAITFGGTFGLISLTLVWDQFPTTGQDLDLHLFNARDERVAVAQAPQRGFDPPREELQHLVEEPGIFKLKVKAAQLSRPVNLQIFSLEPGHTLTPNVPYSSVVAPADCACALAVGAMNLRDWDRGRIAPYSARGPTTDGRTKPDLIAPDGMNGFSGTSAAAPVAAGAAALVMAQHPDWSTSRVERELAANAEDLLAPGPDVQSGHGALQLQPGRANAARDIPDAKANPGDTVNVAVTARMPGAAFGQLSLTERLPNGFTLQARDGPTPEPTVDDAGQFRYRWSWAGVGPGAERTLRYRLQVPDEASPGTYNLTGTINGQPIDGDATIRVRERSTSLAQALDALTWRASSRTITLRLGAELPPGARWHAQLFDLDGRQRAASAPRAENSLTLAPEYPLANGVYLMLVTIEGADGRVRSRVHKVVVQR